jgi:GNAT superfamily N-acetyltransferase
MEIRNFYSPSPDYYKLVARLYGSEIGQKMDDNYKYWLDNKRKWKNRLSWIGVGVYNNNNILGHMIVQQSLNEPTVFFGFVESEFDTVIANEIIQAGYKLIPSSRKPHVFAPVNLSLYHNHRFTIAQQNKIPFHEAQQLYYQELFSPFFKEHFTYRSFVCFITPSQVSESFSDVKIRPAELNKDSNDWKGIYDVTKKAFLDTPSPPSFEEFFELYSGLSQRISPEDIIIAEKGNKVIGYNFQFIVNGSLAIKTLAVDPDWQREGVGKLVYEKSLERARKAGCKQSFFLFLRSDRLIDKLRPSNSQEVSSSVLFHSLKI